MCVGLFLLFGSMAWCFGAMATSTGSQNGASSCLCVRGVFCQLDGMKGVRGATKHYLSQSQRMSTHTLASLVATIVAHRGPEQVSLFGFLMRPALTELAVEFALRYQRTTIPHSLPVYYKYIEVYIFYVCNGVIILETSA